jgi:hypothetical protein
MPQPIALDPATAPLTVMFVRHAEKPGEDGPPHGINHRGERDPHCLSVRGWTRAGALASLFSRPPSSTHPMIVVPERVVATKPSDEAKSRREFDTAEPLASRLGLDVDDDFGHSHEGRLRDSIMGDPRSTCVVWHHGGMSHLVSGFPMGNPQDVPDAWPEDRFDLIWILERRHDETVYTFAEANQSLLVGDVGVGAPHPR